MGKGSRKASSASSSSSSADSADLPTSVPAKMFASEAEEIEYLEKFLKERQVFLVNAHKRPPITLDERTQILEDFILKPLIAVLDPYLKTGSISGLRSSSSVKKNWLVQQITGMKSVEYNSDDAKLAYDWVIKYLKQFISTALLPTLKPKNVDLIFQANSCWVVCETMGKTLNYFWKQYVERHITITNAPHLHVAITAVQNTEFFEKIKDKLKIKMVDEINELRAADWQRNDSINVKLIESDRYHFLGKAKDLFFKIGGANGALSYVQSIEEAFFRSVKLFYEPKCVEWKTVLPISSLTIEETFLGKTIATLSLERQRGLRCLDAQSMPKLDELITKLFISPYIHEIESFWQGIYGSLFSCEQYELANCTGFEAGLVSERHRHLARCTFEMISILDNSVTNDILGYSDKIAAHIGVIFATSVEANFKALITKFKTGTFIVQQPTSGTPSRQPSVGALDLLKPDKDTKENLYNFFVQFHHLYAGFESLLTSIFNSNVSVSKLTSSAYLRIANLDSNDLFGKPFSESLAMFFDMNLVKNKPKVSIVGDNVIQKLILFAINIDNKVTLMNYLQHYLFYRVSDNNYEDLDKENTFNSKIVAQFGLQMAVKLIRLLHSLSESTTFASQFMENDGSNSAASNIEISPLILDAGVVVRQKKIQFKNCPIIAPFTTAFERLQRYYMNAHGDKRKLDVLYSLGNCQVKCTFFSKGRPEAYTATTGVLQAIFLSAFNAYNCEKLIDRDGYLSFEHLDQLVQMIEGEFGSVETALRSKLIHSLVKSRLLVQKLSPGVENSATSIPKYTKSCMVKANPDYRNPNRKFAIPSFKMEFTEKINIQEELNMLIDTAVVRIMKARRTFKIQELTAEVQQQLAPFYQFSDVSVLKRRYESLIDREFIARDEDDMNKYVYLP